MQMYVVLLINNEQIARWFFVVLNIFLPALGCLMTLGNVGLGSYPREGVDRRQKRKIRKKHCGQESVPGNKNLFSILFFKKGFRFSTYN